MSAYQNVKKLFLFILGLDLSENDLQSKIQQMVSSIDKRWISGGALISDIEEAMENVKIDMDFSTQKLNKIAELYPYLMKSENFKKKVSMKYVNVKESTEIRIDEWGLPVEEVTMSANVAPPQVIVPLGMVKAGRPTPVLMSKKKKKKS